MVERLLADLATALDGRGRWAEVNGWLPVDALHFEAAMVNAHGVASTFKGGIGHAGE